MYDILDYSDDFSIFFSDDLQKKFDFENKKVLNNILKDQESELNRLMRTYKKGDLKGALKTKNEIMLYCKEYYGINHD
jgi:hypothetical protein